jgi:hypothetical protein
MPVALSYRGVFWKRPGQIGAETGFRAGYRREKGSLLSRIGCWSNFSYLKVRDVIIGRVGFITIGVGGLGSGVADWLKTAFWGYLLRETERVR